MSSHNTIDQVCIEMNLDIFLKNLNSVRGSFDYPRKYKEINGKNEQLFKTEQINDDYKTIRLEK
jgi:hypothetical protein